MRRRLVRRPPWTWWRAPATDGDEDRVVGFGVSAGQRAESRILVEVGLSK
jgi:hypothetical protein